METAQQLVANFVRMVRADGGSLELLSAEGGKIRVGYAPGHDEECTTGACILPHVELQQMMTEWLARRDPSATVIVQLVKKPEA